MWDKNNITVEVAINIVNRDKKSTWLKLLKDYLSERDNNENR